MESFTGVKREYHENGAIKRETYYENGTIHRIGSPARIVYYFNGKIAFESYYDDGKRHRIGGPAKIFYNETYTKYIYYQDDKYYNPYGPTEFRLTPENLIIYKDYFSRIKKSFHVKGPAIIGMIGIQWGIYGRFETMQIKDF